MLDLNTTEARRAIFQPTADWLKAGGLGMLNDGTIGFHMGYVLLSADDAGEDHVHDAQGNACGTICCIAGHIAARDGKIGSELLDRASSIFDEHGEDLRQLFFPDFYARNETSFSQITAEQAAKVVEWYIQTGIVDWKRVLK